MDCGPDEAQNWTCFDKLRTGIADNFSDTLNTKRSQRTSEIAINHFFLFVVCWIGFVGSEFVVVGIEGRALGTLDIGSSEFCLRFAC
jgi:hypothetical protein